MRRGRTTFTATLDRVTAVRVEVPWDRPFEVTLERGLRLR